MDEAASTAGAAVEKKRPLLHRVPTSLIVTLVGIALTAWLLPAFTRQWDDRQKAHELKTSLVTEMTAATAAVLVRSRHALEASTARGDPFADVNEAWLLASIQIEEKFRAYFFGTGITDAWHNYSALVNYTLARLRGRHLEAQDSYQSGAQILAALQGKPAVRKFVAVVDYVSDPSEPVNLRSLGYTGIQKRLLTIEEILAVRVLNAHAAGYSTTLKDFFRDLIP